MDKLKAARDELHNIDKELAMLFEKRMETVSKIAEGKKELGLPVENKERESEFVSQKAQMIDDPKIRSYYVNFLESLVDTSKKYQHFLLKGMKIAFSGVEGAFANIAAKSIFPDAELVAFENFKEAYKSVETGLCDCAVLPIENSFAGDVGQVMDMGYSGDLYINGIYELHITQNLLGVEGADISKIKKVISHPQALAQCTTFIKENGFEKVESTNTAAAAKKVSELQDPTVAAIASEETAKLYGLKILQKTINEDINNTTRFAVFSRVPNNESKEDNHFIMFFTVKHEAGSLSKAVSILGEYGFNLHALKSRPTRDAGFEYYFYVEGEGTLSDERGKAVKAALKENCRNFKIAGTFHKVISLKA